MVALVLVGAASVRSLIPLRWRKTCECIPVIGEGLEIFNKLETHYMKYRARTIFYYLLYPLTSIFGFIFGGLSARRELGTYFHLIRWLIILLAIESAAIYYELSQHFSLTFTLKWLYLELLCLYFLANFFMVPLSTLSLKLSISQKRARLFISTTLALVILSGLVIFFQGQGGFYQVIPMNVVLEQRFDTLSERSNEAQEFKLGGQQTNASNAPFKLRTLSERGPFFDQVEGELVDLLASYLPRWRADDLVEQSIEKQTLLHLPSHY